MTADDTKCSIETEHDARMIWETAQAIKVLDQKNEWPRLLAEATQIDTEGLRVLFKTGQHTILIDPVGSPWIQTDEMGKPIRDHIWVLPIWKFTSRGRSPAHNNGKSKYSKNIKKLNGGGKMRTTPTDVTDPAVPVSWFFKHSYMSPGQALSKYLHEELGLTWADAGRLIGKSECTIRRSYYYANQKNENSPDKRQIARTNCKGGHQGQ